MPAQLQLPTPATTFTPASTAFAAPARTTSPDTSANRNSALERRARLTARLAKLAAAGHLAPLARQVGSLGGCARPIRMTGHRTRLDAATGQILDHLDTRRLPAGELLLRCGNRRATRCPSCSHVYRYDTYQLIAAGLRGGKAVPATVSTHPRVFATLTAPGFGPVHNQPGASPCTCGTRHTDGDPLLGTPLDPQRYDNTGAVLWNAHAPALWARFTTHLRREIAHAAGLTQRPLRHHAPLSYAKVAEYQKRGQIHFHTVIRIDGPTGPTSTPPAWATTGLLDHAVRAAAKRSRVQPQRPSQAGRADLAQGSEPSVFRFGQQIDVRAIRSTDFTGDGTPTDRHVAAYIAKYATKGAETTTGTLDRQLRFLAELAQHDLTDHARRMIHTAWHLGAQLRHAHLRLRQWAHMLGFRGHFSTRTRHYSTTLTQLRADRSAWRTRQNDAQERAGEGGPVTDQRSDRADLTAGHTDPDAGHPSGHHAQSGRRAGTDTTLVISHWQYTGSGLLPELAHLADLLGAAPKPPPEQAARPRQARRPGDRAGHSGAPLTAPVRSAVTG
ncbi:replication initiator [Streptomyces sp. NPDC008079]|uniref:replication initiator n=1 Tax=Streptomyces sp. NPDC008079 TaxID=3364806 RepID=UPI0036E9AB11